MPGAGESSVRNCRVSRICMPRKAGPLGLEKQAISQGMAAVLRSTMRVTGSLSSKCS